MLDGEITDLDAAINLVAGWIDQSKNVVVFTGAGVSTESGIPDFRSPGGIWDKYDPRELTFQKFLASEEVRKIRWKMFMEMAQMWKHAKPNPAHFAIAELEVLGKLRAIITQNVDGLHQDAGVSPDKVIELHGTNRVVSCLTCGANWPSEHIRDRIRDEGLEVPDCTECGGLIKTATISFGQAMPENKVIESERLSRDAGLMLVVGSTLVVQPAASMPEIAKQGGARVAIINLSETAGDHYADLVIRDKAGEVLPKVIECYKSKFPAGTA